jgi:hypothetical protein
MILNHGYYICSTFRMGNRKVRVSVLNSGEAYVSKCLSWAFLLVFSPLPDPLGLYMYFLYSPTCYADCHTIYLDCIICFILLSLVPVTCCSLNFKPHQGQWSLCSNIWTYCVCHSLVTSLLPLFFSYMTTGTI